MNLTEFLEKKSILVVGRFGIIASEIVDLLLKHNLEVIIILKEKILNDLQLNYVGKNKKNMNINRY